MRAKSMGSMCVVATALAFGMGGSAQGAGQQPSPPQAQSGSGSSADMPITLTGCIQHETDYRQARDAGRGGVAGTGIGAGNEFVLTDATASSPTASARAAEPASPTGTSGTAGTAAYELTGPNEGQVSQYVGRRVEIVGKLKPAETTASGQPTGGPTAGQPPSGIDVGGKDLKLRELEISSVRQATGTCPAR